MSLGNSHYAMSSSRDGSAYFSAHDIDSLLCPTQPETPGMSSVGPFDRDFRQPVPAQAKTLLLPGDWQPLTMAPESSTQQQTGGPSYPPQCLYQYPASQPPLYPIYQPSPPFQPKECHETVLSNRQGSGSWFGEDHHSHGMSGQTSDQSPSSLETCAPQVSPLNQLCEPGQSSISSTSGSPYQASLEPSSGYGSSTGSTSSSPYASPSVPDLVPSQPKEEMSLPLTAPTDDYPKPKKSRTSYTPEQIRTLEAAFEDNAYPDYDKIEELAKVLGVTERKVKVWFQNKRARWRKKNAASPVYNPAMYSTAAPAKLSATAPTVPVRPVPSKYPAPPNYACHQPAQKSVLSKSPQGQPSADYFAPNRFANLPPTDYSAPGHPTPWYSAHPPSGFSSSVPSVYPNQAREPVTPFSMPTMPRNIVPAAAPGSVTRTNMAAPSTISYLPTPAAERQYQAPAPYQLPYPAPSMLSLR